MVPFFGPPCILRLTLNRKKGEFFRATTRAHTENERWSFTTETQPYSWLAYRPALLETYAELYPVYTMTLARRVGSSS